jgi:hypothetical protein
LCGASADRIEKAVHFLRTQGIIELTHDRITLTDRGLAKLAHEQP